ncbi:MAG TPA: acryloyl-CoA reductase, partial [Alphaproteobacteria bacterium]|nr:acryloyl-CoA reductase [Alphaproteobacteria bacterium]
MVKTFRALVLEKTGDQVSAVLKEVGEESLPEGEVTVAVQYSSLNYKDGLALSGRPGVVKSYPMVPGIDLAGIVESSSAPEFKPGDAVVLTGWGVGERHWGGFAERARLKAEWLNPLPKGLSAKEAMAIGTAGFTAMLCVIALEEHGLEAGAGEVVVTGAGGGVGSVAVALLSKLGHRVLASTGRAPLADYLKDLGAAAVIDRAEHSQGAKKPLGAERWAGAVDTVGGKTLAALLSEMRYGASVAVAWGSTP